MNITPMIMSAMESEQVADRMIKDLRDYGSAIFYSLEWESMYDYDKQRVLNALDKLSF